MNVIYLLECKCWKDVVYIMDKGPVKCDIRKWRFYEFWEQKQVMWVKWEKILIFAALLELNPKYLN